MICNIGKKLLVLYGRDNSRLSIRESNRGEPFQTGVEFDLYNGEDTVSTVFLAQQEVVETQNLLNRLYPIVEARTAPQWVWDLFDDLMERASAGDLDSDGDLIIEGEESGPDRNQVRLLARAKKYLKPL